jgi:hypothetical protein
VDVVIIYGPSVGELEMYRLNINYMGASSLVELVSRAKPEVHFPGMLIRGV